MRNTNIILGIADFRKLYGVVSAIRGKRRGLEPHLLRLESELELATITEADRLPEDVVALGSTVTILDLDTREERTVSIVFPAELDGSDDRISILAPLGTALIGEKVGATVSCLAPGGVYWFNILEVSGQAARTPARAEAGT